MKRASDNVVEKSKKLKPETSQGGLGIILSVTLKNFMCHDHLQFDFDPHVNFIVGQNGSGKSAVMTGIILALGGKSSVTGRYSNIKGFVKTGKNTAHVSVTLKNCGPYAYKPEKYGDKIIVEREISSEGNSGKYKLKNSSGKIESTLKEELNNILIAMDIQIDNPVLVLTQDTSRNFLMAKTGKEGKLFEFFYRGTGLQKLEIEYQQSIAMNEDSAKDLAAKKQALDHMEKEVKRLEKLRKSDEQLDELKRESFWAKVILLEKVLETEKDKKEELLEEIDSAKKEAEKSKNKHDEITLEHDKFKQEKAEIEEKIVTERKSYSELDVQSDTCAGKVRSCKGEVELYKREEKKLLADIRDIEATINEHQRKDQTDYENEKRQRNEEIQKLEEKLSNVDIQKDELETEQFRFIQEQSSQEQELQRLKAEIGDLKSKRNMRHNQYSRVKDSKNNRQIMFGEHTPSVLQEIQQNQRKFRKMPKGPIGLDIEVKESRWTSAVEACIKPHMLRSFCADNSDDSRLLTQILQKYYTDRMPSVIISPFLSHMHNVSQHQAQTNDFPTVLDMLTIKDPVIANCLIDQLSIENIILIEDITTAQNVMLDNPPAKCYSAFLLNCDEILLNPYRYYSASRRPTNVLSRNIDESYLPKLQEEIETIDIEIKKRESAMTDGRLQLQKCHSTLDKLKNKIVNLTTSKADINGLIAEYKQFEEPRNVPEMYDEYTSLKADLDKKQEELRKAEEKLKMHVTEHEEIRVKFNQQRALVTSLNGAFERLGSEINKRFRDIEILASSRKRFEQLKKEKERELSKVESDIQKADVAVKKTIEERKKVDPKPRIDPTRPHEDIDTQIKEIEKVISEQSNTTDKVSLFEKYAEKSKRLFAAKNEYKQIEKENKQIAKMMAKRKSRTKYIINYTKCVMNLSFTVVLNHNGFTGSIVFSKPQSLILEATPFKEKAETAGKKACSSLSGGERSFVTIAFLLSLWRNIPMPFRILDEYDVFMDSNNRHLSINLLLREAGRMESTQFIFLSPLDLPDLRVANNISIKVHKMQAPQRIGLSTMDEQ